MVTQHFMQMSLSQETSKTAFTEHRLYLGILTMSDNDKIYSKNITWSQGEDNSRVKSSLKTENKINSSDSNTSNKFSGTLLRYKEVVSKDWESTKLT